MAPWASPPHWRFSDSAIGIWVVRYFRKMSPAAPRSGRSILIFTSRRPGRRMAGSMRSWRLLAPMTMTLRSPSTPSISARSWGTMVVSTSEEMPVPRVRKSIHLVEEHHDRHVVGRLLLGLDEDLADLALGLADVLVQELRPLDVEEEALDLLAALLGDLLGEVVGHRLGDHRLAAAGRAVEEHALGRRELVLLIIVGVQIGELDGVLDRLRPGAEAAE